MFSIKVRKLFFGGRVIIHYIDGFGTREEAEQEITRLQGQEYVLEDYEKTRPHYSTVWTKNKIYWTS